MQATRLLVQIPSLDHFSVRARTGHGAVDAPVETMVYAVKRIVHNGEHLPDVVRVLAWIPEPMRAYLVDRSRMVDMEHAWVTANVKDNRATLTPFMESGEYELSVPNAPGSTVRRAARAGDSMEGRVWAALTPRAQSFVSREAVAEVLQAMARVLAGGAAE
ncbi:hypothetical protein C5615_09680 [Burkholderia cepacia]|uniref:Uncharacterized protein n=1 Tax=Burkholderia cepacia TaxID=292 RepID=A0A2S8IZD6_BURCE|nr:hypothetical protein [Burkholderia cepacia]PQP19702.1 hypothetical protein C5615_09680 [Burkholderia cepacia]HDR9506894.1 hypothetical protein [Burkholderia cepacia]